jgi:hypothetical protein
MCCAAYEDMMRQGTFDDSEWMLNTRSVDVMRVMRTARDDGGTTCGAMEGSSCWRMRPLMEGEISSCVDWRETVVVSTSVLGSTNLDPILLMPDAPRLTH